MLKGGHLITTVDQLTKYDEIFKNKGKFVSISNPILKLESCFKPFGPVSKGSDRVGGREEREECNRKIIIVTADPC